MSGGGGCRFLKLLSLVVGRVWRRSSGTWLAFLVLRDLSACGECLLRRAMPRRGILGERNHAVKLHGQACRQMLSRCARKGAEVRHAGNKWPANRPEGVTVGRPSSAAQDGPNADDLVG